MLFISTFRLDLKVITPGCSYAVIFRSIKILVSLLNLLVLAKWKLVTFMAFSTHYLPENCKFNSIKLIMNKPFIIANRHPNRIRQNKQLEWAWQVTQWSNMVIISNRYSRKAKKPPEFRKLFQFNPITAKCENRTKIPQFLLGIRNIFDQLKLTKATSFMKRSCQYFQFLVSNTLIYW